MNPSPVAYRLFAGADIAATSFAASWTTTPSPRERAVTCAQTPAGFTAFQDRLRSLGVPEAQTLVVIEATGSYWVALAVSLHDAGFAVAVVNPAHVHTYTLSLPRRATTDTLDARVLAQFAAERQPARWTPPPQVYHELRQPLVARDGLLAMRQQARNQRHALLQWPVVITSVRDHLDTVIAELDTRLGALDSEIAQVRTDGAWAESAALLQGITGIGMVTTAGLLVGTLNFEGAPRPSRQLPTSAWCRSPMSRAVVCAGARASAMAAIAGCVRRCIWQP